MPERLIPLIEKLYQTAFCAGERAGAFSQGCRIYKQREVHDALDAADAILLEIKLLLAESS